MRRITARNLRDKNAAALLAGFYHNAKNLQINPSGPFQPESDRGNELQIAIHTHGVERRTAKAFASFFDSLLINTETATP
jgi:hypothetical protein